MKHNHLLTFGFLLVFFSCGPSEEEIKKREEFIADSTKSVLVREQALQDSLKIETEREEQKQAELAELKRIHNEKIEVGKSIKRTMLTNYLEEIKKDIIRERNRLNEINQFQIGRSISTKEQQLQDQRVRISQLEEFKASIEKEISYTHLHESYEFQSNPKGTVEHLISSAKNNDYSKLRNLVDPYGEFDKDALAICLVEMFPSEMKKRWKNEFSNGRIMGSPKIDGQIAKVEIAIGTSSNKLETINLVNRQGKWYIQSF